MLLRAIDRWNLPVDISTGLMLGVAVVGARANAAGLLILRGGKDESLNLRGAYLEVLGDLLGSVAVVIAAVVIYFTGYTRADSLASIAIFLLIVPRAWSLLRDVVDVLLEAIPRGVDLARSAPISRRCRASSTCTPGRLHMEENVLLSSIVDPERGPAGRSGVPHGWMEGFDEE